MNDRYHNDVMKIRSVAFLLLMVGFLASHFGPPMAFLGMLGDVITDNRFTRPVAARYTEESPMWVRLWQGFHWYFNLAPYAFASGFLGAKLLPDRFAKLTVFPWLGLVLGYMSTIPLAYVWYSVAPWETFLTWKALGRCCEVAACIIGVNVGRDGFPRFSSRGLVLLAASLASVIAASTTDDGRLTVVTWLVLFMVLASSTRHREPETFVSHRHL